jgi:thioredoxin 1
MTIKKLNDLNFYDHIGKTEGLVVVDFWAPWCGPCKTMDPIVEGLAEEMKEEVRFYRVNVDESLRVSRRFGIRTIPTLAFFLGEEKVGGISGVHSRLTLKAAIQRAEGEVAPGASHLP